MKYMRTILSVGLVIVCGAIPFARAVDVDVSVNVKHTVGGISSFDREKFTTVHASHTSSDWTTTTLNDFITGRDVYFGRDTGYIGWHTSNDIDENLPSKPGWAKVSGSYYTTEQRGAAARSTYNSKTYLHPYEFRASSDIMCPQFTPFWPGSDTMRGGWTFSTNDTPSEPFGSATGNHMGQFLNNFYGTAANGYVGRPLTPYVEIMNEPDYPLFDEQPGGPMSGTATWAELFDYHNTVANEIRDLNSDVKIGGFCPSHPELAQNDFQEWTERFRPFLDTCATNMDFFSIHYYDIHDNNTIRKGSNLEATFDMIEQYSNMKKGQPLPFVVSEFGGRDRDLESFPSWRPLLWNPERDWGAIKSINSMLMSFADRPNLIDKTIPFIMLKEEWATDYSTYAHNWRLFRKENEPSSYTGDWVYTEFIKFYDLWKDVNGTRVDIITDDPDVQVDAYVDDDKVYVILNNLNTTATTVDLNLFEYYGNSVLSVKEKNLYWNGTDVSLDETVHAGNLAQVQIESEGAAVLEYTFASPVNVNQTSDEVKYYANSYFQLIWQNWPSIFQINGVDKGVHGDAVLRLGIGRLKARSKQPTVLVNGTAVTVPTDFMGHEGDSRSTFFGLLDIPVPYSLLQSNNSVSVTFTDADGGYVTSVSLRAYKFSTDVRGGGPPAWSPEGSVITSAEVMGSDIIMGITNGVPDGYFDLLASDDLMVPGSNWVPSLAGLQFDGAGESTVTNPITENREFFRVRETEFPTVPVTGVSVAPSSNTVSVGQTLQLTATVTPANAADPSVTWSSGTPGVASVDVNGLVTAVAAGTAVITATATDGGFTDTCFVTVNSNTLATFDWEETTGSGRGKWDPGIYSETDNGVTMTTSGRIFTADGQPYAIKYAYDTHDFNPGNITMEQGGGAVNFVVTSIDISQDSGTSAGTTKHVRGMSGAAVQWEIVAPEDGVVRTYTTAGTGDMGLEIDTIEWHAGWKTGDAFGIESTIDNLSVSVPLP